MRSLTYIIPAFFDAMQQGREKTDTVKSSKHPLIVPIYIPHRGCPHQCIFCDQHRLTGQDKPAKPEDVAKWVDRYRKASKQARLEHVEIAFYGGSFTALPPDVQQGYLDAAVQQVQSGSADSIRVSTRPDAIDAGTIDRLMNAGVCVVELGVQSMDDDVLLAARRGHTSADVKRAVIMLKEAGFQVGIQMMPGLPYDTLEASIQGVQELIDLGPHMARLYPALVIAGTEMERMWRDGSYRPLNLGEAVRWCSCLLLLLETAGVRVIRIGVHVSSQMLEEKSILAGPLDPALRHRVESFIYLALARFSPGREISPGSEVVFTVPPADVSHMKGLRNENIRVLENRWNARVMVEPDPSLPPRSIVLNGGDPVVRGKEHLSLLLNMNEKSQ